MGQQLPTIIINELPVRLREQRVLTSNLLVGAPTYTAFLELQFVCFFFFQTHKTNSDFLYILF